MITWGEGGGVEGTGRGGKEEGVGEGEESGRKVRGGRMKSLVWKKMSSGVGGEGTL